MDLFLTLPSTMDTSHPPTLKPVPDAAFLLLPTMSAMLVAELPEIVNSHDNALFLKPTSVLKLKQAWVQTPSKAHRHPPCTRLNTGIFLPVAFARNDNQLLQSPSGARDNP